MKVRLPGEYRYAVAVRDGNDLWLTLWVRCWPEKGEFFVLHPHANSAWDPHSSLHAKGQFHMKSYGKKMIVAGSQAVFGA